MNFKSNNILYLSYPVSNSKKEICLSSFGVAIIVYLFLIIFQPFGTYNYTHQQKYLLLVPYAIFSFVIFFSGNLLLPRTFQKWRVIEEVSKLIVFLGISSLLNYWYNIRFINNDDFNFRRLLYMGVFTFLGGIPICTLYILSRYLYLKGKNTVTEYIEEKAIIEKNVSAIQNDKILTILPTGGNTMKVERNNFVYAHSQGNYSTIYYLEKGNLNKELVRISLKTLEEQISDEFVLRCHRSFIINTNHITRKKGNAQGYKLKLNHISVSIPVSRNHIDIVFKSS